MIPKKTEESRTRTSWDTQKAVARSLQRKRPKIVWSIAGFDPSGGAGVTADLATFAAHGCFGCSAITSLTVQNTVGVFGTEPVRSEVLEDTLRRLYEDLPPAGVKIGMLGSRETAETVGRFLRRLKADACDGVTVVLDPVLRSSSGRDLFPAAGLPTLFEEVLPHVDYATPNWAELGVLTGGGVVDAESAAHHGQELVSKFERLHVVATGGDADVPTDLLILPGGQLQTFTGQRVATTSTHGTGCAFSSALLCACVHGAPPAEAVRNAKAYVEGALRHAPGVGSGRGPMGLLWPLLDAGHPARLVPCEGE